jgi:KipI family sensor histidine kinase inhibitor
VLNVLSYGVAAVLVEVPDGTAAHIARLVRAASIAGVVDVVPAWSTVLVRCSDDRAVAEVRSLLRHVDPTTATSDRVDVPTVDIPVVYDGPDLAAVAGSTGLAVDQVVAMHSGATFEVAFMGFAPGFGYLTGLPDRLHLPRRPTPRTRVPAGSVAIASSFSAVYPTASPGGWHLLGRTSVDLWDARRRPPALLEPGVAVRFVPE